MNSRIFHISCALVLGLQATGSLADNIARKNGNGLRFQGSNYEFMSFETVRNRSFPVAAGVPFVSRFTDVGSAGYRFSAIVTILDPVEGVQECTSLPSYSNNRSNHRGLLSFNNLGVFTVQTAPCGLISKKTIISRLNNCQKNILSIGCTAIIAGRVVRSKRDSWVFSADQNLVQIDYIEYVNQTNVVELLGKMAIDNIDLIGAVRSTH